jgi:hypothetical protein
VTEADKKMIYGLFIRTMSNQALIMSALASITHGNTSKSLLNRAEELAKELLNAAESVKWDK